jgi:Copper amine oxidase, enzyme domain
MSPSNSAEKRPRSTAAREQPLTIEIEPLGPSQQDIAAAAERLLAHAEVRSVLSEAQYRLLSARVADLEDARGRARETDTLQLTVYDYTNQRMISVMGSMRGADRVRVEEFSGQPLPTDEEFRAAVEILRDDHTLSAIQREPGLRYYRPMPPVAPVDLEDGRSRRLVTVGILPPGDAGHEIVGIDLAERRVIRFESGAPGRSQVAARSICGAPLDADQPTAIGVAGRARVTVRRGQRVLWRFVTIRPADSSGTNGSAIELRDVRYRGKRLLRRAHVPVLNVKYDNDACGPYRDWQNQEGQIEANGTDVAAGFRLCPQPARTIMDTGSDTGNFLGTAVYVDGDEAVLVCEMEAGWYRYVSRWRFHADGSLKPRFGFAAVENSCVCNRHHHHVYWRLHFDIRGANAHRVLELEEGDGGNGTERRELRFEARRMRRPGRNRRWRIRHAASGDTYAILPGAEDGVATAAPDWPFPRGDLWFLRFHENEIDDGVIATGPPYEAPMDAWLNGEALRDRDLVVWYGAHFTHDLSHEDAATHGHVVGPNLKPRQW